MHPTLFHETGEEYFDERAAADVPVTDEQRGPHRRRSGEASPRVGSARRMPQAVRQVAHREGNRVQRCLNANEQSAQTARAGAPATLVGVLMTDGAAG